MVDSAFYSSALATLGFSILATYFYYYKFYKRDISVSIVLYSLLVYSIVYFVSFENNLGLGIGLLGILSLVRLRSTPENPIDIGFIFYSITLGLLNASIGDLQTIVIVDALLTAVVIALSSGFFFERNHVKTEITFDDLDSENLGDQKALLAKIKKQYGIDPLRMKIKNIDYLRDSVTVEISYHAKDS